LSRLGLGLSLVLIQPLLLVVLARSLPTAWICAACCVSGNSNTIETVSTTFELN
jgi:hypothetical protein